MRHRSRWIGLSVPGRLADPLRWSACRRSARRRRASGTPDTIGDAARGSFAGPARDAFGSAPLATSLVRATALLFTAIAAFALLRRSSQREAGEAAGLRACASEGASAG
jgi:hypothetical protein